MIKCTFCEGFNISAGETYGSGIKTMGMMIERFTGGYSSRKECYNGIQLRDGNLLCFDNSAREYQTLGIRIDYCPICGKKLNQDGEEDERDRPE